MARRKASACFDIKFSDEEKKTLADDLCRELDDAINARSLITADGGLIDWIDFYYEQAQSDRRDGKADLPSYLITQDVDALKARLMKAVFGVKPYCFAEGRGQSAQKAPTTEAFMDWKMRDARLAQDVAMTVLGGLLEDCHVLEVSERIETRRIREVIDVAVEVNEQGGPVFGADGKPIFKFDEDGEHVPAQPGQTSAKVEYTHVQTKRLGPQFTPVSMKDFWFLPGHAKHRSQLWGYAKRFYERLPELQEKVQDAIYDKDAVERLGQQSDRDGTAASPAAEIAPQEGPSVEKELFEVSLKRDLDGDGREEWYVVTVSRQHRELLRVKLDTFVTRVGKPRCVPLVLFPRRNSVYGYSYAANKILTAAEEHTALREMMADRGALAANAPITVLQNALWDWNAEPFGIGSVITVRSQDEVKMMPINDVPPSLVEREQMLLRQNEAVSGLSDMAAGLQASQDRTLGENKLVASGSAVRVDEVIGQLHAFLSDVFTLAHAIWVDTLEADKKGLDAPMELATALKSRGAALQGDKFTAEAIKGEFHFEPYGSVETADPSRIRRDFNDWLTTLANVAKVNPAFAAVLGHPKVAKAIMEEGLRAYTVRNQQPFIEAFAEVQQMLQRQQMMGGLPPVGAEMGGPAPAGGMPPEIAGMLGQGSEMPIAGDGNAY